jgi:hypothetical protein
MPAYREKVGDYNVPGQLGWHTAMSNTLRDMDSQVGDAGGVFHVDSYGAVPLAHPSDPIPGDSVAFRAANTAAIQAALDAAKANGGGDVLLGPGVYHTSGPVGFDESVDFSCGINVLAVGNWPTMIWSNDAANPCFRLHTTSGNIRDLTMKDLMLRGGKHNLSLQQAAYNRFENVHFWVAVEWGLQSYLGQQNQFNHCSFTEVGTAGGDAALFLSCVQASMHGCVLGESGGGVVNMSGQLTVNDSTGYGAWYMGNEGYRWDLAAASPLGLAGLPESTFTNNGGVMSILGCTIDLGHSFITCKSGTSLQVIGNRVRSGYSPSTPAGSVDFDNFINITVNPLNKLRMVVTNNYFNLRTLLTEHDDGFIINEGTAGNEYEECVVANNLFAPDSLSILTPLSTSAPSLFDPTRRNIVGNTPIDPGVSFVSSLNLAEQSVAPAVAAGEGAIYTLDSTPNTLFFKDDAGTSHRIAAPSTGYARPSKEAAEFGNGANNSRYRTSAVYDVPDSVTVEAWFKPSVVSATWSTILGKGRASSLNNNYALQFRSTEVRFQCRASDDALLDVTKTQTINTGTWYHLAATRDKTSGDTKIFLNGAQLGTTTTVGAGKTLDQSSNEFRVGAEALNATPMEEGRVQDVRIWNVVRTPEEIALWYRQALGGTETGLVANYRFDGDWTDSGPNGLDLSSTTGTPTLETDAAYGVPVAESLKSVSGLVDVSGATHPTEGQILIAGTGGDTATWQTRRTVGSLTLGAAATTFAVAGDLMTITGDAGANTIATITGGYAGQELTLLFVDALVTITDDNAHTADSVDLSAAFTSADDTVLKLVYDGTSWYEVSRSVN